jgi:hypothetical protein
MSASCLGNFRELKLVSSPQGARSLTEMTANDNKGYSNPIAAEAVGERFGSPPPETGEHAVRPVATSSGSRARVADKTAESVGERAGEAYADATADEARDRSRRVLRHAGMPGRSEAGQFNQQTFVTVVAAFALGYVAALLIHRNSYWAPSFKPSLSGAAPGARKGPRALPSRRRRHRRPCRMPRVPGGNRAIDDGGGEPRPGFCNARRATCCAGCRTGWRHGHGLGSVYSGLGLGAAA